MAEAKKRNGVVSRDKVDRILELCLRDQPELLSKVKLHISKHDDQNVLLLGKAVDSFSKDKNERHSFMYKINIFLEMTLKEGEDGQEVFFAKKTEQDIYNSLFDNTKTHATKVKLNFFSDILDYALVEKNFITDKNYKQIVIPNYFNFKEKFLSKIRGLNIPLNEESLRYIKFKESAVFSN